MKALVLAIAVGGAGGLWLGKERAPRLSRETSQLVSRPSALASLMKRAASLPT